MHLCAVPLRRKCLERAGLFVLQVGPMGQALVLNSGMGWAG